MNCAVTTWGSGSCGVPVVRPTEGFYDTALDEAKISELPELVPRPARVAKRGRCAEGSCVKTMSGATCPVLPVGFTLLFVVEFRLRLVLGFAEHFVAANRVSCDRSVARYGRN